MGLFSRRHRTDSEVVTGSNEQEDAQADEAVEQPQAPARGPWDLDEAPERERVDLGALRIPAVDGLQLRLEMTAPDQPSNAVALVLGGSSLELRAFAAPRSAGLWDELREELGRELRGAGASYELVSGPYGTEIAAAVPVSPSSSETAKVRFIGIDGPRWFVRAVLLGPAATDEEAAEPLRDVLADVVVCRDHQARPPREVLELHLPGGVNVREHEDVAGLDPLAPGPTIAEVR